MNTSRLKRFATEARNKLRQGIENRLITLGFNAQGVPMVSPQAVPGGAVWKDKPCTMAFYRGFKALEEQIRKYGVNHVVEEAAYTWFNRLMAIRILTMNNLCEPVLRYVGSTRTPLIVDEARQGHIPEMDDEDRKALMQLLDDDTKTAEQIIINDDKLDELHKKTFELAQSADWAGTNQQLIDVVLIGRFMERLGDHAVSAARRVVYIVSGFDPSKEPTRDEDTDIA